MSDEFSNESVEVITLKKRYLGVEYSVDMRLYLKEDKYKDIVRLSMLNRLRTHLYERIVGTHSIKVELQAPKFFDWLFKKRKIVEVWVDFSDVLIDSSVLKEEYVRMINWDSLQFKLMEETK